MPFLIISVMNFVSHIMYSETCEFIDIWFNLYSTLHLVLLPVRLTTLLAFLLRQRRRDLQWHGLHTEFNEDWLISVGLYIIDVRELGHGRTDTVLLEGFRK